jgi:hypothetical protein
MNRRGLVIALVAVGGVIAVLIVLLATGGTQSETDKTGDVLVDQGSHAPRDVGIADIAGTSVTRAGDEATFTATANHAVPHSISNGSLEYRWEIQNGGNVLWILSVAINVDANASLLGTQVDYSSTTIDKTLPGKLTIKGSRVQVVIDVSKLKGWPDQFDYHVESTLDANRADTKSALAHDRAPDEGDIPGG